MADPLLPRPSDGVSASPGASSPPPSAALKRAFGGLGAVHKPPPTVPPQAVFKKPAVTATATPRRPHAPPPPVAREASPELDDAARARRAQEDEIAADELAIARLEAEIERLEAAQAQERAKVRNQDEMIARLLAANDASFASLPPAPTFDFQAAVADPEMPSALPLAVSDPLPQLRAFSALTFSRSLVSAVPPGASRRHEIAGYAGAPVAALGFKLALVVARGETVEELACSVSQWARGELAPTIAECTRARDPKTLLWALSTYQPLAVKRAKTWARLCWRYPALLPQYAPRNRTRSKGKAYKPSPREVNALLGDSVLRFRRASGAGKEGLPQEFVVRWNIKADDVGEAVSTVDGNARVPDVWTHIDADGSLPRVAPLLKDLVAERGVFAAVKCMVELLFPDENPRD